MRLDLYSDHALRFMCCRHTWHTLKLNDPNFSVNTACSYLYRQKNITFILLFSYLFPLDCTNFTINFSPFFPSLRTDHFICAFQSWHVSSYLFCGCDLIKIMRNELFDQDLLTTRHKPALDKTCPCLSASF